MEKPVGDSLTAPGPSQPVSDYTPRQRLTSGIFTLVALAVLIYMSIQSGRISFTPAGGSLWFRVGFLASSAVLMFSALSWIFVLIRRKSKIGRFFLTRAETMTKLTEQRSKIGAGKPFGPQAKYWIFPLVLMAVLVSFAIGAIVASTCLGPDASSLSLRILLLALAATLLTLPAWFAFKTIQRKRKSGSFLPSEQELAKARAKCAAPKPLQTRLLMAGVYWLVAALWTTSALVHRHRHSSDLFSPWLLAGLWWFLAALWTWQLFRPRAQQCDFPDQSDPLSISPDKLSQ